MERYKINRIIRNLLDLSGRQLAERVEVTKTTISNYEQGMSVSRPVERVIEIELDQAIEECTDEMIKDVCYKLKHERSKNES